MNNEQLSQRITMLENEMQLLKASATLPYDFEVAIRDRLKLGDLAKLTSSTKTAGSESRTVNEAGTDSYSVARPMDGFRELRVDNTTFYIPYYL